MSERPAAAVIRLLASCPGVKGSSAGEGTFMTQQPPLAIEPAAVTGERSVATDQAMAGDDDGHGVLSIGQADRTRCRRAADRGGALRARWRGAGRKLPAR